MKIVQTKIYRIDELDEHAQQVAITDWLDNIVDVDLDYVLDDFKCELADYGFTNVEIQYSGFWSQGDGASFTGFLCSVEDFLAKNKKVSKFRKIKNLDEVSMNVTRHNYQYSHERTVGVELHDIWNEYDGQELEDYMNTWVEDYCLDMYKKLQNEYENNTFDENIFEDIKANEINFTADGKYWSAK